MPGRRRPLLMIGGRPAAHVRRAVIGLATREARQKSRWPFPGQGRPRREESPGEGVDTRPPPPFHTHPAVSPKPPPRTSPQLPTGHQRPLRLAIPDETLIAVLGGGLTPTSLQVASEDVMVALQSTWMNNTEAIKVWEVSVQGSVKRLEKHPRACGEMQGCCSRDSVKPCQPQVNTQ